MNLQISNRRQFLIRLAGTLLATALLIVLIRQAGWTEILAALKKISFANMLFAIGLIVASRLFVIGRWYILLRSGGVKISFADTTALTFTGLFSANFLPTTIGGDVVRLAGAMQMGFDRAVCLASIAADRLVGMLGMIFTLPYGLFMAWTTLGRGAAQSLALSAFFSRLANFLKRTLQTFSLWFKKPFALLASLLCTWGHMLCTFGALYILIQGLGSHVSFWMIAGLWSVSYFVTLVPISINGYGVQELSLTFLFSNIGGLTPAVSLTVAVLMRVLYMTASLPGAIYMPGILAALDTDRVIENKNGE
ncbi:MAG: flippase-like domain-containing protein [Chloroflexi bacterium]|nr:flippase-like domain-containing protein [Chloroflexota bacterium]MBI1856095.1 flippase-like domain-containing protein [Chloroflexota bacterium]MBI3338597.1 flippase-like domain-containing protein [Chloroflexota bacterium]